MPITHVLRKDNSGLSVVELLIGVAMVTVIAGFVVVQIFRRPRVTTRTNAANEIAAHLKKARSDSMRRRVTDVKQMAQVKVFNRQFYSVAIDADGDGQLDIPLVMSFPDQGIEIAGPFPKTFIFDESGKTVDANKRPVPSQAVILRDSSGATAIKLSEGGQTTVLPAVKGD